MEKIYYNGQLIDASQYREPQHYCYEVVRLINGSALYLAAHLARLNHSLELAGQATLSVQTIQQALVDYVSAVGLHDQNVRIIVATDQTAHLALYYMPSFYPPPDWYKRGVKVKTALFERTNPHIKQRNDLLLKLRDSAKAQAVYEFLLVDQQGAILEGSKTNVFFITADGFVTPPSAAVLAGITRRSVIDTIAGFASVAERTVAAQSLPRYEAAFLTGTSIGVLPIARIDQIDYRTDNPLLVELIKRYQQTIEQYITDYPIF